MLNSIEKPLQSPLTCVPWTKVVLKKQKIRHFLSTEMRVQTVAGPIIAINSPSGLWIQNSRHNVALKLADHSSDKIHKTGTLQQLHCILNIGQDEIKSVACKSISMIICEIFTVMISSQFDWRESFCADPSHYWSRGEGPVLAKWMGHANNSCQKQIFVLIQIQNILGYKHKYKNYFKL